MANIANLEIPNKVYQKLNQLEPTFKELPVPVLQILKCYTPLELYKTLNYYHSSIDFQKENVEITSKIHEKVCYLKDIFLELHALAEGWIFRDNLDLSRTVGNIKDEFINNDNTALLLINFLRYNTEYDSFYHPQIYDLQATFLSVALHTTKK